MERKKYLLKTVVMCVLMLIIAAVMITRMAYVQLVRGAEAAAQVQTKSTRPYKEPASRGKIADRNGATLVSDEPCYDLSFDYYQWKKEGQNEVILRLCKLLSEQGFPWNDDLPITQEIPYVYTYTDTNNGVGRRLMKFLDARKWDRDLPATRLFTLLCERYGIDESMTSKDKRMIMGVRYYMEDCEFSSYNSPVTISSNVDIDTVARITAESASLPGVTVEVSSVRKYETPYASHILGRVALISSEEYAVLKEQGYGLTDSVGKDGLEKSFERYLRGIDGKRAVEVDRATGAFVGEYLLEDPLPGQTCRLTIDAGLQKAAEESLAKTLSDLSKKRSAKDPVEGGAAVVISVKTGEILAMASYPTYSLENFSRDYAENSANKLRPFFNRTVMGVYPPGSTFKMVTALASLEEGVITPQTRILDKGVYTFYAPSYTPACWVWNEHRGTHGSINVSEAIKYSCNYFFFESGRILGIERLNKYAKKLGLGAKTGVELPDEKAGNLAGPESRAAKGGEKWKPAETIQAAIGQTEQQFTPLQLASYVATVVSGGKKYKPHLLKERWDYTDTKLLYETTPQYSELDFSKSTVTAIKKGMKGVVTEDGTASSVFRGFPVEVGGKTGSAQTQKGRSAHGVFVSFAPYDDPEIAVCVVGEYAGSGGSVAPVCVAIYRQYFGLDE